MKNIKIAEELLKIESFRSPGPGGQRVNKVETGVRIRYPFDQDPNLTPEQKEKIKRCFPNRITKKGELLVEATKFRSKEQNKQLALSKLYKLIEKALTPEKPRIPTKKPRWAEEKRLEEKRKHSEKKKQRRKIKIYY